METSDHTTLSEAADEEVRRRLTHAQLGRPLSKSRKLLVAALGDESWRVRKEAVEVLLAARPDEHDIHQLIELLRDEDNAGLRNATAELLVRLASKAVPALAARLHDDDRDLRKLVVDALAAIGGKEVLPGLTEALSDDDVNVASAAAEGLGTCGDETVIPALLQALEDHQHEFFRYNLLAALGRVGVPAPLPPVIRELVGQAMLRRAVYDCLGRIGGDSAAVELLLDGALSPLPSVRNSAIRSLSAVVEQIPASGQQQVIEQMNRLRDQGLLDSLLTAFSSAEPALCGAVVNLLALLSDPRTVPTLLQAMSDERLSAQAASVLQKMGAAALEPALLSFPDADEPERAAICALIGLIGQADTAVNNTLTAGLHDASAVVRKAAVSAVGGFSGTGLLERTVAMLDDEDAAVREAALKTLRRRGSCDREPVREAALQLYSSSLPEQRKAAALLFAAVGDCEFLARQIKDVDPAVREAAVRAIGKLAISGSCGSIVMALVDEVDDVRIAAAEALGVCRDCKAVYPLRLALKDQNPWVQAAALRSLLELAGKQALPDVLELWQRGDEIAQLACLEAFDLLAVREGFELISQALGKRDGEILKGVIEILARHAPDLLAPWMQHVLCHHDWDVRITAVRACSGLPEAERKNLLSVAYDREDNDLVKHEIGLLIDRF